jgi:hypothetical protein
MFNSLDLTPERLSLRRALYGYSISCMLGAGFLAVTLWENGLQHQLDFARFSLCFSCP